MELNYISITQDDHHATIANAVLGREREFYHYQINIENYTAMLADLPQGEWPDDILALKGKPSEASAHLNEDMQMRVHEYQYRDRLKYLLMTERIEQSKTKRVLDALVKQLPEAEVEALVLKAKAQI